MEALKETHTMATTLEAVKAVELYHRDTPAAGEKDTQSNKTPNPSISVIDAKLKHSHWEPPGQKKQSSFDGGDSDGIRCCGGGDHDGSSDGEDGDCGGQA